MPVTQNEPKRGLYPSLIVPVETPAARKGFQTGVGFQTIPQEKARVAEIGNHTGKRQTNPETTPLRVWAENKARMEKL